MVERQANARYPSQLPRRGGCGSTPLHGETRMPEHLILQTASNNGVRVLKSDLYFGPYGGHCIYFAGKKKPPRALGFCAGMKMSISILVQGPKTPTLCGREEPERGVRAAHCLGKSSQKNNYPSPSPAFTHRSISGHILQFLLVCGLEVGCAAKDLGDGSSREQSPPLTAPGQEPRQVWGH